MLKILLFFKTSEEEEEAITKTNLFKKIILRENIKPSCHLDILRASLSKRTSLA